MPDLSPEARPAFDTAWHWYAVALAVVAADQAAKWVAVALLAPNGTVAVLPFLSWTFACNTGAAFSLFQGFSGLLAALAAVVAVYLAVAIWRWRHGWLEAVAYALVLGGAVGNLADRLLYGCVVDFVHLHYSWFNFPVFNVADSAITVGVCCWIGCILLGSRAGQNAG